MSTDRLSEAEETAIAWLKAEGAILVTKIPDRNEKDCLGAITPGLGVFRKLERKGLVFFTEEEPVTFEDGFEFTFTNSVYLVTGS
jgi:hypothetical protein